jgi:hypothetical protein
MAPFRLLDLLGLYQTIASSGFFDLNYPVIYRAFTLNFSWAMGLFPQSPTSSMQRSITNLRHLTGGNLAGSTAGGSVALVNRKLRPFGRSQTRSLINLAVSTRQVLTSRDGPIPIVREVQTVTAESSNVLDAGIPIYANTIGIATANAFITAFFSALILLAIALALLVIIYGVIALSFRNRPHWIKTQFPIVARSWLLRIVCFRAYAINKH